MANNDAICGFSEQKADMLLALLGLAGSATSTKTGMFNFVLIHGVTGGGGIAADSSGTVTERVPTSTGWTAGTATYTAYNLHPTVAVGASRRVIIAPVNGEWVVIWEACP